MCLSVKYGYRLHASILPIFQNQVSLLVHKALVIA